jgi:hypothetical protein
MNPRRLLLSFALGLLSGGCAQVDSSPVLREAPTNVNPLRRDAGTPDAGSPHHVRDAGVEDAGPRDAGDEDAGRTDAGPSDAGAGDAGSADSGTPADSGAADAGALPDGGAPFDPWNPWDPMVGEYADGGGPLYPFPDGGPGCADPGTREPDEGFTHVSFGTPVTYYTQPPSSGNHWPSPAPWGIYPNANAPGGIAREQYVHNEEHGGIVMVYNCPQDGGCPDLVAQLTQIYWDTPLDEFGERKIVITPDPDFSLPDGGLFGMAAWDFIYDPSAFDQSSMDCFVAWHQDRGREELP